MKTVTSRQTFVVPKGQQEMKFPSEFKPYLLTIQHNSKKPLNKWSPQSGGDGGRNWLRRPDHFNIAVILAPYSPYFVLDIDGEKGYKNLRRLQIAYGKLPTTYTVQTPSGGMHFYFKFDPRAKRTISFIAKRIDTIVNGYCLISPSTINGKQYKVVTDAPIVSAPDWLIKLASNTDRQTDTLAIRPQPHYDDYADRLFHATCYMAKIPGAVQGQSGHSQLLRTCRLLARFRLDDYDAQQLLVQYNQRCSPPWDLSNPKEARDFWRKWRITNG